MSKRKFKLYNRYGLDYELVETTKGVFLLTGDYNQPFGVLGSVGENIKAVDPTGGPFIACGAEIEDVNGNVIGLVDSITNTKDGYKIVIR